LVGRKDALAVAETYNASLEKKDHDGRQVKVVGQIVGEFQHPKDSLKNQLAQSMT